MTTQDLTAGSTELRLIDFANLRWVAAALAVMGLAMVSGNLWFLNFVHVLAGLMWTGIDLFMGFVLGPVLRRLDLSARRQLTTRLMPRMIFLMPTLSVITGTAGWWLAEKLGYFDLGYPEFFWVVAALVVITLLTVQGLGVLLPTNVRICLEMQKEQPDPQKMHVWMRRYLRATAFQGMMQVGIIIIMARFVSGL